MYLDSTKQCKLYWRSSYQWSFHLQLMCIGILFRNWWQLLFNSKQCRQLQLWSFFKFYFQLLVLCWWLLLRLKCCLLTNNKCKQLYRWNCFRLYIYMQCVCQWILFGLKCCLLGYSNCQLLLHKWINFFYWSFHL